MEEKERDIYRMALAGIKGITVESARFLISTMGSEERVFTSDLRELERITGLGTRHFNDSMRRTLLDRAREEMRFVEGKNIRLTYFTDAEYPQRLLECQDAPLILYRIGRADLNARHVVGVVGTRNATHYGVNFINKLIDDLSARLDSLLIVSGLALGCDVTAHRRAMANDVATVGVVAHGLDTIYPAENRNDAAKMVAGNGAVITDYMSGTRPFRGNFLARNRIVAGMVDCLVVAESAANHGGALHTARLAREYNREVFALPGRTSDLYSGGCNKLIRNHTAQLITSADDLIDSMGWTARQPAEGVQQEMFRELSADETKVINFLRQNGDAQINQLTAATGIPVGKLMGLMMELEMAQMIISLPGSRYRMA